LACTTWKGVSNGGDFPVIPTNLKPSRKGKNWATIHRRKGGRRRVYRVKQGWVIRTFPINVGQCLRKKRGKKIDRLFEGDRDMGGGKRWWAVFSEDKKQQKKKENVIAHVPE